MDRSTSHVSNALAFDLPDDDGGADRRSGVRYISVLRVGRAVWEERDQLCVVRNVSPNGLMFECLHPPDVGQTLVIELRSDKRMSGTVRWTKNGNTGVELDEPINVDIMLREDRGSLLRVRPRMPRFVRRGTVKLIGEDEPVMADIVDIASGGVRCRPELPVRMGEPLVASIEGLCATNAEVRWRKGDVVGLRFEKQLPWRQFQQWLDRAPRS